MEDKVVPNTEEWDHVVGNVHTIEEWDQFEDWEDLIGLKWLNDVEEDLPEYDITEVDLDDMDDLPWLVIEEPEEEEFVAAIEEELSQEGEIEAVEEQQNLFKARNHMRGQKHNAINKQNRDERRQRGNRKGKGGQRQIRNKGAREEQRPKSNRKGRNGAVQRMKAEAKVALNKLHYHPQSVSDLNMLVLGDFQMKPMDFLPEPPIENIEKERRLLHSGNRKSWNKGWGNKHHQAYAKVLMKHKCEVIMIILGTILFLVFGSYVGIFFGLVRRNRYLSTLKELDEDAEKRQLNIAERSALLDQTKQVSCRAQRRIRRQCEKQCSQKVKYGATYQYVPPCEAPQFTEAFIQAEPQQQP